MATGISSPLALGGLYASVDGRYVAANNKPFTSVSNAESALNGFPSKLSESCIGLTVLVKESGWTEAKEYWVQPKGTTPETYGLVEKGAGTTDYNDLENKPTIGDGTNTALPIVGNVKVSAVTAYGSTAGVTVTPGQNTGEIEMQFTLPKGADGADGQDGADGADGADAVNPFKGYYPTGVSKPAAGTVGDYLYAPPSDSQSTATATIWHYDSTQTHPWTDTEIDVSAVVGVEFGSGQAVNAVHIKDLDGNDVNGDADVLSEAAGNRIKEKLYPISFDTIKGYDFDGVDDVMTLDEPITLEDDGDFIEIECSAGLIGANWIIDEETTTGTSNPVYSFAYQQHPTSATYKYNTIALSRNRFFVRLANGGKWIGYYQNSTNSMGNIPQELQTEKQRVKVAFEEGYIKLYVNGTELEVETPATGDNYKNAPYQYSDGDKIIVSGFGASNGNGNWLGKIYSVKTKDGFIDLSNQTFNGTVETIEQENTLRDVLNAQANVLMSNNKYAECTSLEAGDKVVSNPNFALTESCRFLIKFEHKNSKSAPTLKVGNTDAKPLYYNNEPASATNSWSDGDVIDVYYDGTKFNATKFINNQSTPEPSPEPTPIDNKEILRDGLAFAKASIPSSPWFDGEGEGYDYQAYLDKKIASVPNGKSFIFITDTHYVTNKKHSVELIDYVRRKLGIRTIISGGDVENESVDNLTNAVQQWVNFNNDFVTRLRADFKQVCGDHDHNGAGAANNIAFNYRFVQKMMNGYCEDKIVYDTQYEDDQDLQALTTNWTADDIAEYNAWQKMHYYFDDESINTRFIVLHTGWGGNVGLAVDYFNDTNVLNDQNAGKLQFDFVYNALMSAPTGCNIVIAGHNTITGLRVFNLPGVSGYRININDVRGNNGWWYMLHGMLHAYKSKDSYTVNGYRNWTDAKNIGSKTFNFASAPDVNFIMEIGGDIHYDMMGATRKTSVNPTLVAIQNVAEHKVATNGVLQQGDILTATVTTDGVDRNYRGILDTPDANYDDAVDSFPLNKSFANEGEDTTDKTQSFDIITLTDDAVYFTRIGDGYDRVVHISQNN